MSNKALMVGVLAGVLMLADGVAQADVYNMPTGQTSLDFVTVGNPGNAADPSTGYGAVPYTYQMGTYDVTIGSIASSSTPWRRRTPTACTTVA